MCHYKLNNSQKILLSYASYAKFSIMKEIFLRGFILCFHLLLSFAKRQQMIKFHKVLISSEVLTLQHLFIVKIKRKRQNKASLSKCSLRPVIMILKDCE